MILGASPLAASPLAAEPDNLTVNNTTAATDLRFLFTSGNFAGGHITLWGVKEQ